MPVEDGFEPDRLPGVPHPREQTAFFGHREAERAVLDACRTGRLHHAWLIGGPLGIGKATLAYRVARFLLAEGAQGRGGDTLDVSPQSPAARQVAALSHPNLIVLRRTPATDKKGPSTTIPVDAARRALTLFGSTSAGGGWRVSIVDSAEDLTAASANALLKLIEEPPPRSLFLIVSHAPQRVLPTIRSRCRRLLLQPMADDDLRSVVRSVGPPWAEADDAALAQALALAEGSARRAIEFLNPDKAAVVREANSLLDALPSADRSRVLALAERLARRDAEDAYGLVLDAVVRWTAAALRARAPLGASRLAPLVEVCEKVARAVEEVDAYNLDRRPLILSMFGDLAEAVRRAG
jgi:DNA polymerase III subunit delta'